MQQATLASLGMNPKCKCITPYTSSILKKSLTALPVLLLVLLFFFF